MLNPSYDLAGRRLDGPVWKGLAQPSKASPASWFCEPGRHSKGIDCGDDRNVWSCWRCGARGFRVAAELRGGVMDRYEVVITVTLDAESPEDASLIAEGLVVIDPSHDENDIDFMISAGMEI